MFLKIFTIICGSYFIYGIALFSLQRTMMYPRGYAQPLENPIDVANLQTIWLQTSRGKVEAWFIPAGSTDNTTPQPAVILAHANAELIDYCVYEFLPYTDMGMHLLLVEYPGYGRSAGRPKQGAITEAFVAAYDWLVSNKRVDRTMIVAHGRSLGGGVACMLVREREIRALILQSTFTNAKQFARQYLLPGFLVLDKFNNEKVLREYPGPVLILHGRYDEMIPYKNGVALSKAAKQSTLITYNCHHNDCPPDEKKYWDDLKKFLEVNNIID